MKHSDISAVARTLIRRPPAEVFAAFADAEKMSKFWFTRKDRGLRAGESVEWFLGSEEGAPSFFVEVKEVREPERLVIEWTGQDGNPAQVTWSFEETEDGDTILTIAETGYSGSHDAIIERALDSTGGFNQVVVAAKAFIEHGAALNVVADHA